MLLRFARPCSGSIVLLALHVGLDVGRRHQLHFVPRRGQFARPVVRRGTSLDVNDTGLKLQEKGYRAGTLGLGGFVIGAMAFLQFPAETKVRSAQ